MSGQSLSRFHERDPRDRLGRLGRSLLLTVAILAVCLSPPELGVPAALRLAAGVLLGGLLLRLCSFAHDWAHGAILERSRLGAAAGHLIGLCVLAPVRIWRDTHDTHHANNARLGAPAIGALPLWTLEAWRAASPLARLGYRLSRSPALMLLAWPLVFVIGLNLVPLALQPRR